MKYGLFENQLKTVEEILASHPEIEEAVLFGSRAIDTFKEASDVDIALKGKKVNHKLALKLQSYFEEETDLPYFFDFASYSHIDNKKLIQHIDKEGIVIYRKGWRTVKIKDIGRVITGKTPSKNNPEDWGNQMPFITPTDYRKYRKKAFLADRNLSKTGIKRLNKKIIPVKSSMVTCIGSDMGKICMNGIPVITNQQINSVIPKHDIIENDFLYYKLVSMYDKLKMYGRDGTAVPIINKESFSNITLFIPPLPEQEAIAEVLSSLDDKIELLHKQNKTLEDMAQTLFHKWFIEDANPTWKKGNLDDVVTFFDKERIPLSKMQRNNMKQGRLYPYYGAATIMDHINKYIFDGEYILLGEDGTVRTNEGYPILQYATGKFWVNNHTHIFQAKPPYTNFFIWLYLLRKNIDKIITGAVQPKINQTNLKKLDFPKFPKELINSFNKKMNKVFHKTNSNKTQIQTLETLRDILLPKLITGQKIVNL